MTEGEATPEVAAEDVNSVGEASELLEAAASKMLEKDVELLEDTKDDEGCVEELELLEATTDVEDFEELLE